MTTNPAPTLPGLVRRIGPNALPLAILILDHRVLASATSVPQARQSHRARAAGGADWHHGKLLDLRDHDRGRRPFGGASAGDGRAGLLLRAGRRTAASLGDPRGCRFGVCDRVAKWRCDRRGRPAADHRDPRDALDRAWGGTDHRRHGPAPHQFVARLHLHRLGFSARPARFDLHFRVRRNRDDFGPEANPAWPARRCHRRQRAGSLSQRPPHAAHQDTRLRNLGVRRGTSPGSSSLRRCTQPSRPMDPSVPSSM